MYSLFRRFIFCFPIIFVSIWVLHSTVRPSSAGPFDHDDKEVLKSEKQCYREQLHRRPGRAKRETLDRIGGLPPEILALQSNEMVPYTCKEKRLGIHGTCNFPKKIILC